MFVGNRVAQVMELIPPDRWRHILSEDSPADCASRGMYPSEPLTHTLRWNGLELLGVKLVFSSGEVDKMCSASCTALVQSPPLIPFDRFSTFIRLAQVTAWMMRFVTNGRSKIRNT